MTYTYTKDLPLDASAEALVVPLTEAAVRKLPSDLAPLDAATDGQLRAALASGDFTGEEHTTLILYPNGGGAPKRVLLVGAGKPKDRTLLEWQHIVGTAARAVMGLKVTTWSLVLPLEFRRMFTPEELGSLVAKGVLVSTYHFVDYKSDAKAKLPLPESITVGPLTTSQQRAFAKGVAEGMVIGEAMNWMRHFGDMPSSDATPTYLAARAEEVAKRDKRFRVKIIDRNEMEELGMGALLGVARGADTPPKCIVLEWRGAFGAGAKELTPRSGSTPAKPGRSGKGGAGWYALVGKGITFDTGGISIKPSDKLDEMKFDMSGGAAVLGAMRAIGDLDLPVNIVAVVPACDNMPSGSAYKPGDIVRTMRGKTIEVQNTDAEGRIILADGLGYVQQYEPKAIVDLATLTAAIVVALGYHYTGLFANDAKLRKHVEVAAERSGDRTWPMPLGDAYTREVASDIADWANIGKTGRYGGAVTAAAFLEQFVEGRSWVHLDIAGTAWATAPQPWLAKGATGVGVHLLVELAKQWSR